MRVILLTLFSLVAARADVAVLMLETTGTGVARFTEAGHSAVYLSNVCQDSPVRLRLCQPGEPGSVISNYSGLGEARPYAWNVAPAPIFFYGVENPDEIPLYGNPELLQQLQERYREKYLSQVCPETPCGSGNGRWRDMAGATFSRGIWAFRVKSTREQDQELIDAFNAMPNVNHYNGFLNNCADFAGMLVNRYFPGSARRDHLNDFFMTSPKAVAKSFAVYAKKHPELEYSVEHYPQLPGPIRRSFDNRKGTEVAFRAKGWSIPLMVLRSHFLIYAVSAYYLTGRFNPEREYQAHRIGEDAEFTRAAERKAWDAYKQKFVEVKAEAIRNRVFDREKDLDRYLRASVREGSTSLDSDGTPVLNIGGERVGLTRETITRAGSDPTLGERLMLAKVEATLKAPLKNRENLSQFQQDWKVMEQLGQIRAEARVRNDLLSTR